MNSVSDKLSEVKPTPAMRAEAAAWNARLHSPNRSAETEESLRRWLDASPLHASAFEEITSVWDEAGGISVSAVMQFRQSAKPASASGRGPTFKIGSDAAKAGVGLAALATLVVAWTVFFLAPGEYSTDIGEQRSVTLKDGTRLTLNTDSRVAVGDWHETREVRLVRGEAYFEVAKDASRPFVVVAGERKVVALGTSFFVRLGSTTDVEKLVVTLVEGKVAVAGRDVSPYGVLDDKNRARILEPGDRLINQKNQTDKLDKPKLDRLAAWRRGEVILEETSLRDAVAEMNRYSVVKLAIENDALATLPVSGIFRVGDADAFASAVASLYGLEVVKRSGEVVLAGRAISRS